MTTQARYEQAVGACLAACAKWQSENQEARLKFCPILAPGALKTAIVCDLGDAVKKLGVAGNSTTRQLLMTMHRATPGGATVFMADFAIEQVYGISRALSEKKS